MLGVPRRRGAPSMGPYNHREGTGYVPYHRGDYHDAIENGKSRVRLIVHEATFGGMSPYAAARRSAASVALLLLGARTRRSTTPAATLPRPSCRTTHSASRRPA